MVWTLSGAQLKDTEEFPPSQKMLGGGLARRIAHTMERYGVAGLNWEKIEEYLGLG